MSLDTDLFTATSETPIFSAISERGHHAVAFPWPSNSRFAMRRSITHCRVLNAPDSWSGLTHETEPRKYWPPSLAFAPMNYGLQESLWAFFMMIDIVLVFLAIVVSAHDE